MSAQAAAGILRPAATPHPRTLPQCTDAPPSLLLFFCWTWIPTAPLSLVSKVNDATFHDLKFFAKRRC